VRQPGALEIAIRGANARLFGRSGRTISIIYFWEVWPEMENGSVGRFVYFREYENKRSRYYDDRNRFLFKPAVLKRKYGQDWVNFSDIVSDTI
jgi:hypothetical protein